MPAIVLGNLNILFTQDQKVISYTFSWAASLPNADRSLEIVPAPLEDIEKDETRKL